MATQFEVQLTLAPSLAADLCILRFIFLVEGLRPPIILMAYNSQDHCYFFNVIEDLVVNKWSLVSDLVIM